MSPKTPLLFRKLVHCCKHLHILQHMHLPASSITTVIKGNDIGLTPKACTHCCKHLRRLWLMHLLATSIITALIKGMKQVLNQKAYTKHICPFVQKRQWYHVTDIMCQEQEIPCFTFGIQSCFQDTKTWVEEKQAPHLLCRLLAQLLNLKHFHLLPSFA